MTDTETTFCSLELLARDLKKSLAVSSSAEMDRQLKVLTKSIECIRDSLDRARKLHEVSRPRQSARRSYRSRLRRRIKPFIFESNGC